MAPIFGVDMPRYSDSPPPRRGRGTSDGAFSRDRRDDRDEYEEPSEWGNTTHTQRRVTGLRKRNPAGVEVLDGSPRKRTARTPRAGSTDGTSRMTVKGTLRGSGAGKSGAGKSGAGKSGAGKSGTGKPGGRTAGGSKSTTARSGAASGRARDAARDTPRDAPRGASNRRTGKPSGAQRSNDDSDRSYQAKRKRTRPLTDPAAEILKLAPRRGAKLVDQLHRATDAFAAGRDRDAIRMLRPLRQEVPQSVAIRELLGVALYRVGNFRDARAELETFADLTGSVEQHPVLMDIARAQRKPQRVTELWKELSTISPSAALVTEGRIVYASMLADEGDLAGAIAFIEKGATQKPTRIREHHVRRWYVLGDLYDRSGNVPRARAWFERVAKAEPGYADVAERLSRL